jgi:hypothetical protein
MIFPGNQRLHISFSHTHILTLASPSASAALPPSGAKFRPGRSWPRTCRIVWISGSWKKSSKIEPCGEVEGRKNSGG